MSFKLPGPPPSHVKAEDWADWMEILAFREDNASFQSVVDDFVREVENTADIGCESEEDQLEVESIATTSVIESRIGRCDKYPFVLEKQGRVLKRSSENDIYKFLLYATRQHMNVGRLNGVNGAELFEELSAEALRAYLGAKSRTMVFGTSASGSFEDKVNHLCQQLGEGRGMSNHGKTDTKDGGLDVVGWLPFHDKQPAKLLVMGQCKTGDSWRKGMDLSKLNKFGRLFINGDLGSFPTKSLFVPSTVDDHYFLGPQYEVVIFDRLRIASLLANCEVPEKMMEEVRVWNAGIEELHSL